MANRVITAYTRSAARIRPSPAPSLSFSSEFSLLPESTGFCGLKTPGILKRDVKSMVTLSSLSFLRNTASGSTGCERPPSSHFDGLPL